MAMSPFSSWPVQPSRALKRQVRSGKEMIRRDKIKTHKYSIRIIISVSISISIRQPTNNRPWQAAG